MRVLLDSHVILWWLENPLKLRKNALSVLHDEESDLYVSAASWWELGIKRALGRLRFDTADMYRKLSQGRITRLDVTFAHAEKAANLPSFHADPFDRMLLAQALHEDLVLMTRDKAFERYGVPVLPS